MKRRLPIRVLSLLLALALLFAPAAQALTLEQARMLLTQYYIDDIPASVLEQDSIASLLEALGDPYTVYFTAEENQLFADSMRDQDIVGIGIAAETEETGLRLMRVYEDTPAAQAGLQPGDLITLVDGRPTAGEDIDVLTAWIQGAEGTQVHLTWLRGDTELTATLTRQAVVIPATVGGLWADHIGYLDCDTFGEETLPHFQQEVERYAGQATHWVVDLRSNTGGGVDAAVQSAGVFTGPETLAYLQDGSNRFLTFSSEQEAQTQAPVLVLVDQYTASAAELFAAAIRDTGRGLVIGTRTFGKGVAQIIFDQTLFPELFPDGDALKITAYRFYSAAGVTDDLIGVFPHLLVAPSLAEDVAVLLCAPEPEGSTENTLRLEFGGCWYIDLEQALSEEYRTAFTALLAALPPDVPLFSGAGSGWVKAPSPAALLDQYRLTEYSYRGFSDAETSPYALEIDTLGIYHVLQGAGDGTFRPNEGLTRAQLCSLLAQALNCHYPAGESRFSDVSMDAWYGPAVNALAELGLVSGVGGDQFHPDDPVNHEQLITILSRLGQRLCFFLDFENLREHPSAAGLAQAYPGWSDWSREHVWLLSASQKDGDGGPISLLWEPPEHIDPTGDALRGEAASLTCRLLYYLNLLP